MHCEAILAPKGVLQDEESVIEPQSADFILVPTEIPPDFLIFFGSTFCLCSGGATVVSYTSIQCHWEVRVCPSKLRLYRLEPHEQRGRRIHASSKELHQRLIVLADSRRSWQGGIINDTLWISCCKLNGNGDPCRIDATAKESHRRPIAVGRLL